MSFINIINESFDKRNKSILTGSNSKKLKEAAFTDNFNGHSDELDRFYDYMFEAAKDLGFQDFDVFDDGWTVTLTYIDSVGNKQQAEFDFDDELSFESKEDAIDCLVSLDWKVVDDEDTKSLREYFDYGEAEDLDELDDMLDQSGSLIYEAAEKLGFKDFEWEDSVQGPYGRSDFWITGDDGTRLHAMVDFSETWVTDVDEAIMLLDNLEWEDASDNSDIDDSDDSEEFYQPLLKQSFGYLLDASRELGLKDFDYDYNPSSRDMTLRYIDRDGNKRQAYIKFAYNVFFPDKDDAMRFLKSRDWEVVDDGDDSLDIYDHVKRYKKYITDPEILKKYGKRPNYVTQLKTAFKRVDDTYDLSVLVDDLMYGFYEKTRKILASKGFTNFSSEPSTENMMGEDFFWAEKDGVKYEGSYDFETELEDISDFVINSNATTRKDLFNELAEWYADLVLSTLEPVEDDEDDEDDDLDENIFIKKQKRKSQKLKEDTKKLYRYIVVDHFSPEDFYLIKSNHPVDENMFDAWNFLDVTDKHGKGTVIWNDEYIDFNESGNKSIADLDDEYRKEMVRYLSDLEKNSTLDKIKDDYLSLDELQYQGYLTDFPVWIDPGDGEGVVEDYMNDKTLKNSYLATMYSDYLENSYVDNDSSSAAVYIDIDDLTQYMDYEEFFDEDDENED